MKRSEKVILILITILFVLVIISILSCIFKDHPALLGADYSFRTTGYSMFPVVRPNDLVFVKKGINKIEIDDIICSRKCSEDGDYLIGHRVIEIQIYPCLAFKTKGDANGFDDGWVSEENIIGKQIFNIPFGSFLAENCMFLLFWQITILVLIIRK